MSISGRVLHQEDWMQTYKGFERKGLARIGVVCRTCGTEVIFDLDREPTNYAATTCPNCNGDGFLPTSAGFGGGNRYNIVTAHKLLRDWQLNSEIRFYYEGAYAVRRSNVRGSAVTMCCSVSRNRVWELRRLNLKVISSR